MSAPGTAAVARVPTASAGRYLQQLAKHWSHRMPVRFDPGAAEFDFPGGARLELTAGADALTCRLGVPDGGDAARVRRVVEEHLDRFAFREGPLSFDWRDG